MLRALPFAIIAAISVSRMVLGPGVGPAALLAVAPAGAAAVGGCGPPWPQVRERWRYPAVRGRPTAGCHSPDGRAHVPGRGRRHGGRCAGQQGPQAPGPGTGAGPANRRSRPSSAAAAHAAPGCPGRLAAGYLSASSAGRVGGDLYEVVTAPECVRLVAGDARGKGLPAVQSAAAVLGAFREAAPEADSLAAIVSRIEASLARQLRDEQFATAILAEISADGTKIEPNSCGHPAPREDTVSEPPHTCSRCRKRSAVLPPRRRASTRDREWHSSGNFR